MNEITLLQQVPSIQTTSSLGDTSPSSSSSSTLSFPVRNQIPKISYTSLTNLTQIASGLTADIYLGQGPDNKSYILKLFNEDCYDNYQNEIKFISTYNNAHPSTIIPIYSYGSIKNREDKWYNRFYIVMEYAPLGDLVNVIESSNISLTNAKAIFKQLLNCVKHFHQSGFIHRDIKPENFLLFENGDIKLTDFGFCESKSKLSLEKSGTPGYMAPEILELPENGNNVTTIVDLNGEAIDVFSLGVIAFILVTGELPFENADKEDECYKHIYNNDWDAYWQSINQEGLTMQFKEMFMKMVCYDKNERWSIHDILESDWIKK